MEFPIWGYCWIGQGTIRGPNVNNTLNVSTETAVLQVDQGGMLVLNP